MPQLLRKNTDITWREVNGEIVLLNPKTGSCFGLQAVGASFWELADGSRSLDEIIRSLLEEYAAEETTLTDDIRELVAKMTEKKLILLD